MKRYLQIALILLGLVCVLLCMAACGADEISAISIDSRNMPQTVFVAGQELNLSGGILKAQTKKGTEEVSLDSTDVIVTGYSKDQLGKQELTVAYKGQTTTMSITVVPRVQAENYETDYFVGDALNQSKGSLIITRDDGTSFHVPLNDATVTVTGFDSTQASDNLTLAVRYLTDAVDYSGNFTVKIYSLAHSVLKKPDKTNYNSHESEISLRGGYLSLKTPEGKDTRYVELTSDMITGFDPGLATEQNRTTPLEQTVYVNYGGRQFPYTVYIKYTDVSSVKDSAAALSALDFENSVPEITDAEGTLAMEALQTYRALSASDKARISEAERDLLIRLSVAYSFAKFNAELQSVSASIAVGENDTLSLAGNASAAQTRTDLEKLADSNSALYYWGGVAKSYKTLYAATLLTTEITVEQYLTPLFEQTDFELFAESMNFMLQVYDALKQTPFGSDTSLNEDYFKTNDGALRAVLQLMKNRATGSLVGNAILSPVANWCGGDLNKLYSALCYSTYLNEDANAVNVLKFYYMPSTFSALYQMLNIAISQQSALSTGRTINATAFFYYSREAQTLANAIKEAGMEEGSEILLWLYQNLRFQVSADASLGFDQMIEFTRRVDSYGTMYYLYPTLDNDACNNLLNDYLNMVSKQSVTESEMLKLLMDFTMGMTPREQYLFIRILHPYYGQAPRMALNFATQNEEASFVAPMAEAVKEILSEKGYSVFCNLMLAAENYMRYCNGSAGDINNFITCMNYARSSFSTLNEEEKQLFQPIYDRYEAIYERYDTSAPSDDLGEWQDVFTQLVNNIRLLNYAGQLFLSGDFPAYETYIAIYLAKVQELVDCILTEAPDAVKQAYIYNVETNTGVSLEALVANYRVRYIQCMMTIGLQEELSFTDNPALVPFLKQYGNILAALTDTMLLNQQIITGSLINERLTNDQILALLAAYRALPVEDHYLFNWIDTYSGGSFTSFVATAWQIVLNDDMNAQMTDMTDAEKVALVQIYSNVNKELQLLLAVQSQYTPYQCEPTGAYQNGTTYKDAFCQSMTAFETAYSALTEAEKAEFDRFAGEALAFYRDAYQAATTPSEAVA